MNELIKYPKVFVNQRHEIAEFFSLESRNKYEITTEDGSHIGFAAEQQKGFLGFLFRQFLGHWRTFDIHFFTDNRLPWMSAHHPFRWFFQCLLVHGNNKKYLGSIEKRFSILTKRFDVLDAQNKIVLQVESPFFKWWTFEFMDRNRKAATVNKKWSGFLTEVFTDKDKFLVEYNNSNLPEEQRQLVLAAALFIDLQYFERKANRGNSNN